MRPVTLVPERITDRPEVRQWLNSTEPVLPFSPAAREDTRLGINAWLDDLDLGPPLRRIGDHTKGKTEIVDVLCALNFHWVTSVVYAVILGGGTRGYHLAEYSLNSKNGNGAVFVPAIRFFRGNKFEFTKYLVEEEWRVVIGEDLVGYMRGWAHPFGDTSISTTIANKGLAALPLGVDEQRVCVVLSQMATRIDEPIVCGPFFEDSGRCAGSIQSYVVPMDVVVPFGRSVEDDGEAPLLARLNALAGPGKKYMLMTMDQLNFEMFRNPQHPRIDSATAATRCLSDLFTQRTAPAVRVGMVR